MNLCGYEVGLDRPLFRIAGPWASSSSGSCRWTSAVSSKPSAIVDPVHFKSSYDKANRSSARVVSRTGMEEGLRVLVEVRKHVEAPVLTDVHTVEEVAAAAAAARRSARSRSSAARPISSRPSPRRDGPCEHQEGQFLAPEDMRQVVASAKAASGACDISVRERGASFGYHNLVSDVPLAIMRATGCPVVFEDASRSAPGRAGHAPGVGRPARVRARARPRGRRGRRCRALYGSHPQPEKALSDGPNAWPLGMMRELLETLVELDATVKRGRLPESIC